MFRILSPARILLPCALSLTACGATDGPVPAALLIPAECPAVPAPGASDRTIGAFVLALSSCAKSRGNQIEAIAEILTSH